MRKQDIAEQAYRNGYEAGKKDAAKETKDKIEQGTLIELPCKVGDEAFLVIREGKEAFIENGCVTGMNVDTDGLWVFMRFENGLSHCIHSKSKGLFFSAKEAEKRLLELQGE
jgi:hypothetical protein